MRQARAAAQSRDVHPRLPELSAAVEVRHHPAARRMTLRVSRTRRAVIVTLPMQCDIGEATPFIHRHIDWVRERLGSLPQPVPFRDGAAVPLRGETHRLEFAPPDARTRCLVEVIAGSDEAPRIVVAGDAGHAPRRLENWLMAEARRDLDIRVMYHAGRMGLRPKRLVVRDQTSRWGSCSTTGLLSFSWRLIMAPPFILDYVAAHEVAHLAEMNHGPRFWSLVSRAVPYMDEARTWLRTWGMDLHRYGTKEQD